jgi:signal transduction histidine kinase
MDVTLDADSVPVRVGADDLAACIDALVGNVFAHTPEGCAMELRLGQRPRAGAVLVVADEGPGLPGPVALRRGHSGSGSTGLGLDIVRHIAHRSGGGVSFGRSPAGGAMITVELGPAVPAPVRGGRGFRTAGMAPAVRRAARHRATKTTATQTSATQTSATQRDAT